MSRLVTPLPRTTWLHAIDTLEWSQSSTEESVRVEIIVGNDSALSTTLYYPPNDSRVYLRNVAQLLFPFVDNELENDDSFDTSQLVKVVTNGLSQQTFVIPTTIRIAEDVESFTSRNFLSLLSGKKLTPEGATERLNVYAYKTEFSDLQLVATWEIHGEYQQSRQVLIADKEVEEHTFCAFDFSPKNFLQPHPLARLVQYEISFGERRQLYEIVPSLDGDCTTLTFINSFGQLEDFHAFGLTEEDHKYNRSSAIFPTGQRIYDIEANPEYELNTGLLEHGTQAQLEDLLRSRHVWIGQEPIVITDASHKPTSNIYARTNSTLTYQFTKGPAVEVNKRIRIFDDTFDDTFE